MTKTCNIFAAILKKLTYLSPLTVKNTGCPTTALNRAHPCTAHKNQERTYCTNIAAKVPATLRNVVLVIRSTMLGEASHKIGANHMSSVLGSGGAFPRALMHRVSRGPRTPVMFAFLISWLARIWIPLPLKSKSYTGHTFVAIVEVPSDHMTCVRKSLVSLTHIREITGVFIDTCIYTHKLNVHI